jgi:hypothetical protein
MMFRIEMLSAYEGDSLWVEYGAAAAPRRMIIDAGRKETYRALVERVVALDRPAELFVMTHIDDDHIFGAVPLFGDARVDRTAFNDIWYNGYTHLDPDIARRPPADLLGPANGEILAALLLKGRHRWNEAFDSGASVVVPGSGSHPQIQLADDMVLTLLCPTWDDLTALKAYWERELDQMQPGDVEAAMEIFSDRRAVQPDVLGGLVDVEGLLERPYEPDAREPNGSSIAFLAEHDGHAVLFTGDAHPPALERSIEQLLQARGQARLALDALKVSHHGSKGNTSPKLLELLDCRRYLISTNGSRHDHPDQEAIAWIVDRNRECAEPTELYFNYRTEQNEVWDDDELKEEWNYRTHYPPAGCLVDL